jgi:hypothetical protein
MYWTLDRQFHGHRANFDRFADLSADGKPNLVGALCLHTQFTSMFGDVPTPIHPPETC